VTPLRIRPPLLNHNRFKGFVNFPDGHLEQISRSEDDVSQRLVAIFEGAISATPEEMQRARERRERGNPPGKANDTLGDQIAWEQLLTHCKKAGIKRVWIASNDGDYFTKLDKRRVLLNPFLRRELMGACGDGMEAWCFDNAMTAVKNFVTSTGLKSEKLPNEEETKKIEEQLRAPPPTNWLPFDDEAMLAARHRAAVMRASKHLTMVRLGSLSLSRRHYCP
jgi:hypothetical protein